MSTNVYFVFTQMLMLRARTGWKVLEGFPLDLGFFHLVIVPSPLGPSKIIATQERQCRGSFQLFKASAWKGCTTSLLISVARWLRGIAVTWTQEGEDTVCR